MVVACLPCNMNHLIRTKGENGVENGTFAERKVDVKEACNNRKTEGGDEKKRKEKEKKKVENMIEELIEKPRKDDILLGRGRTSWSHEGNKQFRSFVGLYLKQYIAAKNRSDKTRIVHRIYDGIIDKGGRFLKLDTSTSRWSHVDRKVAREKIAHALRDAIGLRIKLGETDDQPQELQKKQQEKQWRKERKRTAKKAISVILPAETPHTTQQQNTHQKAKKESAAVAGTKAKPSHADIQSVKITQPPVNEKQIEKSLFRTIQNDGDGQTSSMTASNKKSLSESNICHTFFRNQPVPVTSLGSTSFIVPRPRGPTTTKSILPDTTSTTRNQSPALFITQQPRSQPAQPHTQRNDQKSSCLLSLVNSMLFDLDTCSIKNEDKRNPAGDASTNENEIQDMPVKPQTPLGKMMNKDSVLDITSGHTATTAASKSSIVSLDSSAISANLSSRPLVKIKRQHSFDSMDSRLKGPLEAMSDFGSICNDDMSLASSIRTDRTKMSIDVSIKSSDTEREWRKTLRALKNSAV